MSSSTPNAPRFLLDENVRIELAEFLEAKGYDTKSEPKGTPDKILASVSRREKRILVTNDEGFSWYTKGSIFSVVWLRIPQRDVEALISSFQKMLNECRTFAHRLIVVETNSWKAYTLGRALKLRGGMRITRYG